MNLSRAAFFLPPPPAITTRSLSTCAGSKARDQSGSDSGGETGLELFSRVFIDRRARIVRARQSGPFARELRKAMQARTTREPLVPSYVLTSISLLRLSPFLSIVPLSLSLSLPPFFSYPSILLARAQSYLSSVSVPISDFYLSLSIPLYRSPPPSLLLSFSAPRYFARFKRVTLFFSLSSSMIFFHTYSHSFLLFLSFIPFLSLSLLFSRYISSSQLSSCPCSPPYTSLDRSLSLSLSPSISFHVLRYISVPHFHYRSSRLCPYDPPNPHHSSFLPSNFPHPPLYRCIPLLALRLLPATHSPPSLSLTHTLSLSVSLYRTVSPVYASPTLSPFLTLFLSLSPSCFEHRRSTFFLAVCPPSPSRVHPIWDSPKRARGGSAHHRLIHDYYHLICPAALFIVRAGEIAGQRRILSLETFWPGDLEQIGSRISADSGSGRRAR